MKKFTGIALAVLFFIFITARGRENGDPNHGVWKAAKGEMLGVSMDVEAFFEKGFSIELKVNGKCELNIDDQKTSGTWTLNNGMIEIKGGGIDSIGSLENGKLTLKYVFGTNLTLIFEKIEDGFGAGGETPSNQP